jgi:DNA-binding transcriptional ArsR family regulator
VPAARKRTGERQSKKTIEEVVEYAISHRTRVLVLSVLNEGVYTKEEIAGIVGEPPGRVANHIRELLDAGSIELARVEKVRNSERHYYRAVEMPFYSDEEVAEWPPLQRQISAGIVIQNFFAEIMAAFWSGKIRDDPRTWLSWRWFNVDGQGREALADEQQRFWDRCCEIEAESLNRCSDSGEESKSVVVGSAGFERVRKAPQ